jgi:hypothetical protein
METYVLVLLCLAAFAVDLLMLAVETDTNSHGINLIT